MLNCFFQEVPERKLSCDHSADKSLLGSMDDNNSGLIESIPSSSIPNSRNEFSSLQRQKNVLKTGDQTEGLDEYSKVLSTPLRLNGGGDTSFEYQENVSIECPDDSIFVNAPTVSTPCVSFAAEGIFPVGERINDISWENSISDKSSTTPIPLDAGTPGDISDGTTLSSIVELDHMADHCVLPPTNLNPLVDPFIPLSDLSYSDTTSAGSTGNASSSDENDPMSILTGLKEKNSERPIIAHLNINSISSKFEPLTALIQDTIDLLLVTESKLDETFPLDQFQIEGFSRPIRLDRNRNGGGLIIFIREGLTCKELLPRKLYPNLECTFLELRIRQCKWLVVIGYNPHKEKIGNFLNQLSTEIDRHLPNYDNLLMLGDWNSAVTEKEMLDFCEMYNLDNLIKEPTCFKSTENPSSIDLMLTNKKNSFQNSTAVETGLSDFHKMTVTVMKRYFKKK